MSEDKCPRCQTSPCYVPMIFGRVECSNKSCENYSASRYARVHEPLPLPPSEDLDESAFGSIDDSYEGSLYLGSNYYHDFSD